MKDLPRPESVRACILGNRCRLLITSFPSAIRNRLGRVIDYAYDRLHTSIELDAFPGARAFQNPKLIQVCDLEDPTDGERFWEEFTTDLGAILHNGLNAWLSTDDLGRVLRQVRESRMEVMRTAGTAQLLAIERRAPARA
jgi:hypothetical protein